MRFRLVALCAFAVACCVAPLAGQGQVSGADVVAYENWIRGYSEGRERLRKDGRLDEGAERRRRQLFEKIAAGRDLDAVKRLFVAATLRLPASLDDQAKLDMMLGQVRAHARTLIGAIHAEGVDDWLVARALGRGGKAGDAVRLAAIEILGMRERPEAGKLLVANLKKMPLPERVQAVLALEGCGTLEVVPELLKLLKQREPNLRTAAVQAIAAVLGPYSDETRAENVAADAPGPKLLAVVVPAFDKLLVREKVWQVRAAVCDALVQLKAKASIPILIKGLERELKRGRAQSRMVAIAFHEGLEQMTGQDLSEDSPALWRDFWAKEGKGFRYAQAGGRRAAAAVKAKGKGKDKIEYAKYFNLEIKSKRVLFVIDFSGSMREEVRLTGRYGGQKHVKYELVKRELERVIRSLPKDSSCNVVFFNTDVNVWQHGRDGKPKRVKMSDANKSDLLQYVWDTTPGGATNLFGALEKALAMGDRGVRDKYYDTAFDTIFLLSDGAPSYGKIVDPSAIRNEVRKINRLRRIKIHTIVFGDHSNNLDFMKYLAKDSGGTFMHVQ